jgi:hypothetical protein
MFFSLLAARGAALFRSLIENVQCVCQRGTRGLSRSYGAHRSFMGVAKPFAWTRRDQVICVLSGFAYEVAVDSTRLARHEPARGFRVASQFR